MYTRSYHDERRGILIPESYGGTALYEGASDFKSDADDKGKNPWEEPPKETEDEKSEESEQTFSSTPKASVPSFLSNIFKNGNLGLQNIGKEEILILAAAAFLFFSKEGDKECAIMLLLLLFLG